MPETKTSMSDRERATMMHRNGECEPKHLRVGINTAMVDSAALARILIAKGLFTWDEYAAELADEMEREVLRYRLEIDPSGKVELV